MSDVYIIVSEATTSIVDNPRFEYATTGYTQVGSVLTRVLTRARFGRASGRVVTANAAILEGAYVSTNPNDTNDSYTGSAYARGAGRVRARLRDQTNGLEWVSDPVQLNDQRWHRFEVSGVVGGVACVDLRLYIETAERIQNVTFYIDGFQIENKNYATTYCDGDLELELDRHDGAPYFEWAGRRHGSNSIRTERYRPAGKTVKLTQGLDHRLYPISASGLGMPPINLNMQQFSGQERVQVQGSRAMPRAVQLTFWAVKDPMTQICIPASLSELHRAREALEAVIKPDRVAFDQPFLIRYLGNLGPMDLEAYYESGLEFSGDMRYPFENSFGVRFFCPDPYWRADSQDALALTAYQTLANADYILMRRDGEWQEMEGGADAVVRTILVHSSGLIFAGGDFDNIGAAGTAKFAYWDGTAWNAVGEEINDGGVYALAEAPNGDIYVGGTFTNYGLGPTTCNRIAIYHVATDTWSQLEAGANPGLNEAVYGIAIAADGMVFIGGHFTADTGAAAMNYVTSYNPTTDLFVPLIDAGANGLDNDAYCVEIDIDGEMVYFGGAFTDVNGGPTGTYNYVIKWDGVDYSDMALLGDGMDSTVRVLRRSLDGGVYAGGNFTDAGWADAQKIAYWNRREWYPLGFDDDGMVGGNVYSLAITGKGLALIGGDFTSATNSPLSRRLASWNRTRFSHLDVVLPGTPIVHAIAVNRDDVYIGFSTGGNATASEIHTTQNCGKANSWPILEVSGPARLEWLENQDTGAVIRMDLMVEDDELVMVDFRRGRMRAISKFRGNVVAGILPDSDIGKFRLLPGDNRIAFLAEDTDGGTEISLRWRTTHWSFDAI